MCPKKELCNMLSPRISLLIYPLLKPRTVPQSGPLLSPG